MVIFQLEGCNLQVAGRRSECRKKINVLNGLQIFPSS